MAEEHARQGKRIQDRRKELGWTQDEFASRMGSNQTQISRWERGEWLPTGKHLEQLALLLDVDVDYILLRQDQKKRVRHDGLSDTEAELLDLIRVGDAGRAIDLMNTLLKQGKK